MRTVNPERHAAKRQLILTAAATVFARSGYHGATTAAICREGGIGSGTLFHYFKDKRSLMLALFGDDIAANRVFLAELDRTDPGAALWQVIDRLAADLASPLAPGLLAAAMQLALTDTEFALLIDAGDQEMRGALAELIQAGQGAGTFDADLDPARAARWVQGIVDAAFFMTDAVGFDPAADRFELDTIIVGYLGTVRPVS